MRTVHQVVEMDIARRLAVDMGYQLSDDEEPQSGQSAGVPKKPINPQGGNEEALPEPQPEPEPGSDQDT